jgi:hypothetical protein
LSWAALAQPVPVEFFVQVLAMDSVGTHVRQLFEAFSDPRATTEFGKLCLARLYSSKVDRDLVYLVLWKNMTNCHQFPREEPPLTASEQREDGAP